MNNLWERGWASLAWRKKSSLSRKVCDQLTRGIHAATTTTSSPVMSRTGFKEYCLKLWNEEKIEIPFIKSCPKNQNMHCAFLLFVPKPEAKLLFIRITTWYILQVSFLNDQSKQISTPFFQTFYHYLMFDVNQISKWQNCHEQLFIDVRLFQTHQRTYRKTHRRAPWTL